MEKETYCVYYEVAEMDHEKVVPIVLDNINYWHSLFSIDKVAKKAKIMGKIFDLKKNIQMFSDLRHMTGHGITELMCESFEYEVLERLGYTKVRDIRRMSLVDKIKFSYIVNKVVNYMKEESIHVKNTI